MLKETPTEPSSSFKTSHVTWTNPGSYKNRFDGYCMIKISLCHSFDMFFNVYRVHCDNYCEIQVGWVRKLPFYSLYGVKFCSCGCLVYLYFEDTCIFRIMYEKFKTKKCKFCLCLPLMSSVWYTSEKFSKTTYQYVFASSLHSCVSANLHGLLQFS
jgi:hypothetical protein